MKKPREIIIVGNPSIGKRLAEEMIIKKPSIENLNWLVTNAISEKHDLTINQKADAINEFTRLKTYIH